MWVPMSQRGHRREAMGRGEKEGRGGLVLCVQVLKVEKERRKREEGWTYRRSLFEETSPTPSSNAV